MLNQIRIRNVALIDRAEITFFDGFSVLTGETGAGKSILIEAFNFVLGERASRELIKTGAEKASVEAAFSVLPEDAVRRVLEEQSIETEDDELILSRELTVSGKNTCRVNGTLVSTAVLKQIGDTLVDIHGQHAHQTLLNPKLHLSMLDAYASDSIHGALARTADAYRRAKEAYRLLNAAQMDERERERRIDLLTYEIKEIDDAALTDGEEEALDKERKLLQNAQTIMEALSDASERLSGSGDGLVSTSEALRSLDSIADYHRDYGDAAERLREIYYQLEDIAYTVRDLHNAFSYDPERLNAIEWRLEQILKLKRKYGASIAEILAYRERSARELERIERSEERRAELSEAYERGKKAYLAAAAELSELRHAAAERFREALLPELRDLGMQSASFSVAFSRLAGELPGETGFDDAEFLLSANRGEPEKPLAKVASGGELSRVMLSFKSVLADSDHIPTMVFDEIDTGVSGRIGTAVAVKMREIASKHQVLCITHLPQIAAYAKQQYLVYKQTEDGITRSNCVLLDEEGRVRVIAGILGSGSEDEIALRHARNLIEEARNA